jgi:hypothetical protein
MYDASNFPTSMTALLMHIIFIQAILVDVRQFLILVMICTSQLVMLNIFYMHVCLLSILWLNDYAKHFSF